MITYLQTSKMFVSFISSTVYCVNICYIYGTVYLQIDIGI